ncbi:MAG: GTP-binding protein, partial [Oscillospiraceae bacterium]|nr:GTP-binding protein [Oscillospiraceae bacterium]
LYIKNFGEFYDDQVRHAGAIVLSRTGSISQEKLDGALALLRERNPEAVIITTPWDQLEGKQIQEAIERTDTLARALEELEKEPRHEHHHHHHDHDDDDDDDDEDEEEHGHHHHHHEHDHDHDHHGEDGHAHHHHEQEEGPHHHHHHHHDHDADELFTSWGVETAKKFTEAELASILAALDDSEKYGAVLRAKGIVDASDGAWLHFDHVPGEADVRRGTAGVTGRLCVIGSELKEDALKELFGV